MKYVCGGSSSSGNCHALIENNKIVLLDCGIHINEIKKLVGWRVSDIVTCFCSHFHRDHVLSSEKLSKMGIDMFEPFREENPVLAHKKDGFYFQAFRVPHGDCTCYGTYLMTPRGHKLVYITDFQYCPVKFSKIGLNTILVECNHDDIIDKDDNEGHWAHSVRDHSSISTVCEFIRVNKTDQLSNIILCHGSENNLNVRDAVYRVKEIVGEGVNVWVAGKGVGFDLE